MKKYLSLITALCVLGGCNSHQEGTSSLPQNSETDSSQLNNYDIFEETDTFANECRIELGDDIKINGDGAWLDDNCITISESGVYTVAGILDDGIIHVECSDTVKIVLENARISNKNGAAIISESKKLIIESSEGSENSLDDGSEYTYSNPFEDKDKHKAAVYSQGDLCFTGGGSLTINGNYDDAVSSAGALLIQGGVLSVTAEDNGIRSEESVTLNDSRVTVSSEKDCIKSDGGVTLEGGEVILNSQNDGIQAETALTADSASISITTTGDILADEELSSKGMKAVDMTIANCTVSITSTDHAIKADGTASIDGGVYRIDSSFGKGISAEGALTLTGADITVINSEEGIESKSTLTIESGNIAVNATDDGVNTGGDDLAIDHSMNINGGTIIVNAEGDGLDSNGDINITGGTVVVFGPVSDGNAPLDCGDNNNSITVTGGKVLAVGSAGMMAVPRENYIASRSLNAQAEDIVTVADGENNVILSVTVPKSAQGIVFSDSTAGEGYKIYKNGTLSENADENGLVTSGIVSGGTEVTAGEMGGMGHGGFGGGIRPQGGRKPMGEKPENGETGTPPEMPEGGMMPENGAPPEFPEGGMMQDRGEPPAMPQGEEAPANGADA